MRLVNWVFLVVAILEGPSPLLPVRMNQFFIRTCRNLENAGSPPAYVR